MKIACAQLSCTGPVRDNNEDAVENFVPTELEAMRTRGAMIVIADGVGGHGYGEKASALAVSKALELFKAADRSTPAQLIRQIFYAANTAVYDEGMIERSQGRMATTLTVMILRNNEADIGHVGDCRVYLVRNGAIKCLTTDHSYVGLQLKMGLITEQEAMESDKRSLLTRTVGQNLTIAPDFYSEILYKDDVLVLCSDGLHGWVKEAEICNAVKEFPDPKQACQFLIGLAEKHNSEDNISVQVVRIEQVEQVAHFHGRPYYLPSANIGKELQPGEVLDGRFLLKDVVARTAACQLFRAIDSTTNSAVAVKVPLTHLQNDSELVSQLQREEQVGLSMSHPNIIRVIPAEQKSRTYLVMEFLEGQTLANLLLRMKCLPVQDAVSIASTLCEALDYMHRRRLNVIHRDLKPENIMVCNDGSIRIMDFGIVKATGSRSFKYAGYSSALGTPDYLAPEQVQGEPGDERTDIYSLGAILYEMVTGSVPFSGNSGFEVMNARMNNDPVAPRKLNPEIPPALEEVILHAMEREPAARFKSAAEMKQELERLDNVVLTNRSDRLKSAAGPHSTGPNLRPLKIALCVALALVVLLLTWHIYSSRTDPSGPPDDSTPHRLER